MIIIGILLAVCAAGIGTTSKQLIAASEHFKKPWLFHLGAGMNIALGPIVDASAYAFAPQVVVAPFACLDVIFNALTAPYTLDFQAEKRTGYHVRGTLLVALGATMTPFFADASNHVYSVRELEAQLFLRPTSLAYLLIELSAIVAANVALKKRWWSPNIRGIALGVVAGVLMGNVFFLKGLIGIIQTCFSTGNFDAWIRPTPYILTACAAGGAVLGHLFMRKGLGEYKGVFMVTIFEGAHISAACFSGCVVMEEMAGAPWWRYMLYWGSVATILAGMIVINKAAATAQIDGKFHLAQSERFAEVPEEERDTANLTDHREPSSGARELTRPVGKGMKAFDTEALNKAEDDIDMPNGDVETPVGPDEEMATVSKHSGYSNGGDMPKERKKNVNSLDGDSGYVEPNGDV